MRHPEYNEGHLKSVFIFARNVQHIILKSKSTKAPLMLVLYIQRDHGISSKCESEVYDFMRNIQGWGGRFHFIHIIDVYNTMRGAQNDIHMYSYVAESF